MIYDGMIGAVTQPGATAYLAFLGARYKLAGKTGTAQVVTVKQTESTKHKEADERKREHAWFIAFAPVDDPKIAISVLVENGGFGGSTAGPIARKVIDTYLLGGRACGAKEKFRRARQRRQFALSELQRRADLSAGDRLVADREVHTPIPGFA